LKVRPLPPYLRPIANSSPTIVTQRVLISRPPTMLTRLPIELEDRYPEGPILRVMKPLYGIAEAGLHWFATYVKHHREKLAISTSAYDTCLLITEAGKPFGMTGLQTDDTLMLGESGFMALEEAELQSAQFRAKPRQNLIRGSTGDFKRLPPLLR
jgi:hypothetical protein